MISFSNDDCGVVGCGKPIQAELAKLVIELECGNNLPVTCGTTGLERKKDAHFVGGWSVHLAQSEEEIDGAGKKVDEEECGLKDETGNSLLERVSPLGDPGASPSGVN